MKKHIIATTILLCTINLGVLSQFYNTQDSVCLAKSYRYFYNANSDVFMASYSDGINYTQYVTDSEGEIMIDLSQFDNIFYENFHSNLMPVKDSKTSLYGYINSNGELIIPHTYSSASSFSNGLAAVSLDKKHGIIDTLNNIVLAFEFDGLCQPINNLIPTQKNDKWGIINLEKETKVDFIYKSICATSQGIFRSMLGDRRVLLDKDAKELFSDIDYQRLEIISSNLFKIRENGQYNIINSEGDYITENSWDFINTLDKHFFIVKKDKKLGVITPTGKQIIEPRYKSITVEDYYILVRSDSVEQIYNINTNSFLEGRYDKLVPFGPCRLLIKATKDNMIFILNHNGQNIYKESFIAVKGISNGLLLAKTEAGWNYYSIFDGSIKLKGPYKSSGLFYYQTAIIEKDDKQFLIDKHGKVKSSAFDQIERIGDSYKIKIGDKWGTIDKNGNPILEANYSEISILKNSNYIKVKQNELFGLYDSTIKILDIEYDDIIFNKYRCDYLLIVKHNKIGFVTTSGDIILEPELDRIDHCWLGLLEIEKDGKTGMINKNGIYLIPPIYEEITHFKDGKMCGVKIDDKWGFVNRNGEMVIDTIYDEIKTFTYGSENAFVRKGEHWFMINRDGFALANYSKVQYVGNSYIVETDNLFGLLNEEGQILLEPQFDSLDNFLISMNRRLLLAELNGKFGLITSKGDDFLNFEYTKIIKEKKHIIAVSESYFDVFNVAGDHVFDRISGQFLEGKNDWFLYSDLKNQSVNAISKSGKRIGIHNQFSKLEFISEDYIKFTNSTGLGLIDTLGNIIFSGEFDNIDIIKQRNAEIKPVFKTTKNNMYGIVSVEGIELTDHIYNEVSYIYGYNLYRVTQYTENSMLNGLINDLGKEVMPMSPYRMDKRMSDGRIAIYDNYNTCGYYSEDGKLAIDLIYNECKSFSNEHAVIGKAETSTKMLYGLVDKSGQIKIPFVYENIYRRRSDPKDVYIVQYKDKKFKINYSGECVEDCPDTSILDELSLKIKE